MFKHLHRIAIVLAICLCFSLLSVYAVSADNVPPTDELSIAQLEITVDEEGNIFTSYIEPDDRDAAGYILYDDLGDQTYQFWLELNGGGYYDIGSASVTLSYGDGTTATFTHGSTREDLAELKTPSKKKFNAAGKYTIYVTGGYVNTYDHFGTLDVITSDRISLYFGTLVLNVK